MTKEQQIVCILTRPEGCTRHELCNAIGWKEISIPDRVRRNGLRLNVIQDPDGINRYFAYKPTLVIQERHVVPPAPSAPAPPPLVSTPEPVCASKLPIKQKVLNLVRRLQGALWSELFSTLGWKPRVKDGFILGVPVRKTLDPDGRRRYHYNPPAKVRLSPSLPINQDIFEVVHGSYGSTVVRCKRCYLTFRRPHELLKRIHEHGLTHMRCEERECTPIRSGTQIGNCAA